MSFNTGGKGEVGGFKMRRREQLKQRADFRLTFQDVFGRDGRKGIPHRLNVLAILRYHEACSKQTKK